MAEVFPEPVCKACGDQGLLAEYGRGIDPAINRRVMGSLSWIMRQKPAWLREALPGYASLLIIYDPMQADARTVREFLLESAQKLSAAETPPGRRVEIPVCYGAEFGPDLEFVARSHDLSPAQVIRLHCQPMYHVYVLGFTPGFPYLGGLPKELHTPRLPNPRIKVPAGSVGIAGGQTGIYSLDSPGGWQIIGRTPLGLFAPDRRNPFLLKPGDRLKFRPITKPEYARLYKGELRP